MCESRRNRFRQAWLAATVVLALVAWAGSQRTPCGPASGTTLSGTALRPSKAGDTIKIGTFNIHGGKGRDGERDLERTAACLAGLDLIALNEVHGRYFWQEADQAEQLARKLGQSWLFAPTEERWWHRRFGNAVLTTIPVRFWQRIPLEHRHGKGYRNLLLLRAEYQGVMVHVVATHIDRSDPRERNLQLRAAGELFLSLAEPAVLMGDMNATSDDAELARILATPGVRDPVVDVLGERAPRRIDWILTRGLRTIDAGMLDSGASDHPHVWAELGL